MFQFTDDYGYDLWEQIRVDYSETNYDELVKMYAKNNVSVKREWHPITPPAEQEAETVTELNKDIYATIAYKMGISDLTPVNLKSNISPMLPMILKQSTMPLYCNSNPPSRKKTNALPNWKGKGSG
jgi:hypothetical protein